MKNTENINRTTLKSIIGINPESRGIGWSIICQGLVLQCHCISLTMHAAMHVVKVVVLYMYYSEKVIIIIVFCVTV